jgi:3',5'-cyclic AMP phosphodiesterase CpdA
LKLFVVSDLHGRFPDSLREAVLDEEPDVVICCRDIAPFRLRDEFFECMYGSRSDDSEKRLWDYIGKARYKAETKKDVADARSVLAALDDLPFPVRFVPGNVDRSSWEQETSDEKNYPSAEWAWAQQDFLHEFTEDLLGVKDISYGADIIGDYVFIGYRFQTFLAMYKVIRTVGIGGGKTVRLARLSGRSTVIKKSYLCVIMAPMRQALI